MKLPPPAKTVTGPVTSLHLFLGRLGVLLRCVFEGVLVPKNHLQSVGCKEHLAVEAVISEPVSALHVPCSAGKYREIADFGLEMAETPALSR
jgi:hypothetical protein